MKPRVKALLPALLLSVLPALAQDELAALRAIEASDLNALAREAVALDAGVLVLVGDKKVILEQLRGLTLPEPVEVDATGSPLVKK